MEVSPRQMFVRAPQTLWGALALAGRLLAKPSAARRQAPARLGRPSARAARRAAAVAGVALLLPCAAPGPRASEHAPSAPAAAAGPSRQPARAVGRPRAARAPAPVEHRAIRASDFIERQAVAAHPHYTDSKPQADAAGMLRALRYLGVHNMRTEGPDPANQGQGSLAFLAANGVRFLFITGGDPAASLRRIARFIADHPGSVELIEGINEPNNAPVAYRGKTGLDAAVAFQTDLYALAKADPALARIPVAGMASWPHLGAPSDLMNLHPYADWARQPRAAMEEAMARQSSVEDRPKGFVVTEGGWHTLVGGPDGQNEGVDEKTQAKLLLNFVLDGVALGGRYVAVYTLYDEYADPDGNDPQKHYGLFRFDGSPKPSAAALRNLNGILRDGGVRADGFAPGSLRVRVAPDAHRLLLQGSGGDFFLILWNEPDLWDGAANRPIDPPDRIATVRLGCPADVALFDPMVGAAPIRVDRRASRVSVALDGHPLVLRLSGRQGCGGERASRPPAATRRGGGSG